MFQKAFDSSYVGFTESGASWLVTNTDIKLVGKGRNISFRKLRVHFLLLHLFGDTLLLVLVGLSFCSFLKPKIVISHGKF